MRSRASIPFALIAAVCLLVTGCSSAGSGSGEESGDPLQVVENPVAAKAARSPTTDAEPAGTVLPVQGQVTALRADQRSRTLAVARAGSPAVLLYDLADPRAGPRAVVPIPGQASDLTFTGEHLLASVPSAGAIMRIPLAASAPEAGRIDVRGKPSATARLGSRTLVALRERKAVLVRSGGTVTKSMAGNLYSIDDVVVADGVAFALDRVRTALFRVDVDGGEIAEGLRAGRGATNATVDPHGRILVTDTRGGALLAFSADPFLLRQRYPVPGGIYGIAYDDKRDLAWVTLTRSNEVVGYDMTGGAPVEEYRFPTVRQPNSVTVDERTGRVIVGSAAGEGMQVIKP